MTTTEEELSRLFLLKMVQQHAARSDAVVIRARNIDTEIKGVPFGRVMWEVEGPHGAAINSDLFEAIIGYFAGC